MTPQAEIPEQQSPRVSVVIVSMNRREPLRRSLETLGTAHQIIVVDNGSRDGSEQLAEDFPAVRFDRLPKNFGLTKAMNIGLRAAEGEYILFLHDDVAISGEAVSKLADVLEQRPEVGAVCPLLTDEAGQPVAQVSALPTPASPEPVLSTPAEGAEVAVECVSGAAIMVRSFFLRALRNIDERYGQFGSHIELCAQVRRAAKKVVLLKAATAIHGAEPSPVGAGTLAGDRAAGIAGFLGKHHGLGSSLAWRLKAGLGALFSFRFPVVSGALGDTKIDGTS